jgi:hypothetical protein
MKHVFSLAALSLLALPLVACNEPTPEDRADVQASQGAVIKDQAVQNDYQAELAKDRAQKAQAKATGDPLRQAKESVEIGADKAMINEKQAEKNVDKQILEEDKEDLRS